MEIEATPTDAEALAALLPEGESSVLGARMTQTVGAMVPAPEGMTATYQGSIQYRSVDVAPDLSFVVEFARDVSAAVVAGWIIRHFRSRTSKLTINRRSIDLDDEGQVRRIVEEEITKASGD